MRADYVQAYINRGDVLLKMNRTEEALAVYKSALSFDAANPDIHYNLGVVALEQGRPDQGLKYLNRDLELDPQRITVSNFEEKGLTAKLQDIEEITQRAEKKFLLAKKLKVMKEEMKEFKLTTVTYKDVTFVLKAYDEVNQKLDDQMVATSAMLSSSNCVLKLRTDTRNWETKLTLMQDIILEINKCQKQWMYLEPIFSSEDIGKTLAAELAEFQAVDRLWKLTL